MSGLSSVFPPPPKYYKYFTAENLEKLSTYEDAENNSEELPFPLQYLVPPKPPTDKYYRSFGSIWHPNQSDLQSLEDAGIKQLYNPITNSSDRIWELKKLLKSLLVNYIELTGIMSVSPERFPEKVEDIRIILINMHHLLNEYRPHQSRESLALLMEEQITERRNQIDTLRTSNKEIKDKIKQMARQFDDVLQPVKTEAEPTTKGNGYFDESSYDPDDLRDKKNKQHDLDLIAKLQEAGI